MKVWEGETDASMKKGLGHYSSTSAWDGNVAVCGHNRGAKYVIGSIKNLEQGDTITYTTVYGTRTYAVETVTVISNTDWSYLQSTADNRITLTTCLADHPESRVVVQAVEKKYLVGESGSGKSYTYVTLCQEHGEESVYFFSDYEGGGFDAYQGEAILFIDEMPAPYYLPDKDADRTQTITLSPGDEKTLVFRNRKAPEVTIFKENSITGEPIEHAKFHITYTSNGEASEAPATIDYGEAFTDSRGEIKVHELGKRLYPGEFTITEVEPADGFQLKEPITQTVIDGFVQTFHKGFAWYHDPFCTIVFPHISKVQFEFVRQRFESISSAMADLLNQMERTINV